MFPIPWNKLFRKKDGSITTIDDAISSGGSSYELPTASAETKGGVKIGSGLSMNGEVLINSNPTPYSLPTASDSQLGGIKVGSGLSILDGVLSVSGGGASSLHMYEVTSNQYIVQKMFVLSTANEENLNTYDKLKSALSTGIGFIVSGSVPGTTYIPVFSKHNGSDSNISIYCSMDSGVNNDMWYKSSLQNSATVSGTKLF